jgi:hypothetical protein
MPTNKYEVIALADKGLHPAEIAATLECNEGYVRKVFQREGLTFVKRKPGKGERVASAFWQDNDATLIANWPTTSASAIGMMIGATKNAVIGRVHRLGLEKHPS